MTAVDDGVVWITGGAGGVGRELAVQLATRGWAVGVCDVDDEALQTLAENTRNLRLRTVHGDITDEAQVDHAYRHLTQELGPITGLVNNALYADNHHILHMPVDEWRRSIDVSLTGYFLCARRVLPTMIDNGFGRVVNMSSGSAERGIPGTGAYAAAKGGVNALTRTLSVEVAPFGVTVNTLTLGPILTPGFAKLAIDEDGIESRRKRVPVGRLGETEDYIDVVELLLSDRARWITGALFHVDGGANNAALVQSVSDSRTTS